MPSLEKTELNQIQEVRSDIYNPAQTWLHAGCNQNTSRLDLACLLGYFSGMNISQSLVFVSCVFDFVFVNPLAFKQNKVQCVLKQFCAMSENS